MRPGIFYVSLICLLGHAVGIRGTAQDTERVVYKTEVKVLPADVVYEFSRTVGPGRLVTRQAPQDGWERVTYQVTLVGEKPVRKVAIERHTQAPVHGLCHMGAQTSSTSRGSFIRSHVLTMHASAYDPSAGRGASATGRTATGVRARKGVVAVDPKVVKLGTRLYVEGYGFAIAADTGGAIRGKRIDLCYNTRGEALRFGRRTVKVHILKSR